LLKKEPIKQAPPAEAVAEAETKPVKTESKPAQAPVPVAEPIKGTGDIKITTGVILDNKTKPCVINGKAVNKYGCKIGNEWYGTFSSTIFATIVDYQGRQSLVKVEYTEDPVTKDGKTTVYYNIVSLKIVTLNEVEAAPENF